VSAGRGPAEASDERPARRIGSDDSADRRKARAARDTRSGKPERSPAESRAPRPSGSTRSQPPGLLASPGAAALRRGAAALAQWLRRPLTSLHLILGVFGLLTLFGLVMVLSASSVESYAAGGSSYSVFVKQLMFCALGLVLFWVGMRVPPQKH